MKGAAPLLSVSGLSARYGGAEVLRGVALDVAAGEAVAVLGRNGAGKTTLAHALLNLGSTGEGPGVAGTVRVMGQDVAGWRTHRIARLGLALVAQGRGVFPGLTVSESLRLPSLASPRGAWTVDRVFAAFPQLAARRAAPSSSLSGGERQLLALGRALLTQPRMLVLDEPSEGLAPLTADAVVLGHVSALVADGMAVLLAEQNVALALRLCPRALVLANNTVAFDGPSAALLADTALVAEHLGV